MKREKKTLALLLAVLLMMSVLAGCGNTAPAAPAAAEDPAPVEAATAEEAPADAAPAVSETDTRTVTDVLGREVEIPNELKTVACPGLPSTRMVVYAGALDRIAGVTQNEKMELVCAPCSDVNHDVLFPLPVIGSGWPNSEIYQEELVTLDPDAIILFTSDPAQADELLANAQEHQACTLKKGKGREVGSCLLPVRPIDEGSTHKAMTLKIAHIIKVGIMVIYRQLYHG